MICLSVRVPRQTPQHGHVQTNEKGHKERPVGRVSGAYPATLLPHLHQLIRLAVSKRHGLTVQPGLDARLF